MRKNVFGRQLKRDKNARKALFKSLLTSLVLYERIKTTEAKAKAIKADADKLITKAKKGGLEAYRSLEPDLASAAAVKKLLTTIAPRFINRQGGYTRIIRAGRRLKDNAPEVILEWTEKAAPIVLSEKSPSPKQSTAIRENQPEISEDHKNENQKKETKSLKSRVKKLIAKKENRGKEK